MATTHITTESELDALAESGDLGWGALARDASGEVWLAFDGDDGPYALRPLNEEEAQRPSGRRPGPRIVGLDTLPLPLTITTEEN